MFYNFLYPLHTSLSFLNVIRYPSFRIFMALLTSALITFVLYPFFIKKLYELSFGQSVRDDGPTTHKVKQGTPTMGGALMIISIVFSSLLWGDLTYLGLWLLMFVCLGYGLIGFVDDYKKIRYKNSKGISPRAKMFWQVSIGLVALIIYSMDFSSLPFSSSIALPFVSVERFFFSLPTWLFLVFALFIVVGTSNAVNLTDGLDGLAIVPVMISSFVFLVLAYVAGSYIGDINLAHYLRIPYVENASELSIFCACIIGSGIGFLWHNTYPAAIFMGDVGSLSLGACLGMLAILTKNELISAFLNGIFLLETISVMLQVTSYKLTKKRIFKMAPIHHHFELLGWSEPKIIVRFWIIAAILGLITLMSLKLR